MRQSLNAQQSLCEPLMQPFLLSAMFLRSMFQAPHDLQCVCDVSWLCECSFGVQDGRTGAVSNDQCRRCDVSEEEKALSDLYGGIPLLFLSCPFPQDLVYRESRSRCFVLLVTTRSAAGRGPSVC
jgi:hypothetical protein